MNLDNIFLQSLSNYCFPAVVALFLLFRLDNRLEKLENAMQQLANALQPKK